MRFHTTRRYLDQLSHCQTAATVFVLAWAACPTAFAVERVKQEAKQIVSREVSKLVTLDMGDSLLDQIMSLPLGDLAISTAASAQMIELNRPEGKYVFNNVSFNDGAAGGTVNTYNVSGAQTGSFVIERVVVGDNNRIDYSATAVAVGESDTAGGEQAWSESGSLSGISGSRGTAISIRSVDDGNSAPAIVDFSALLATAPDVAMSQGRVASDSCPATTSPIGGTGGAAVATVGECVVIIAIVVLLVAVTCLLFGWWGC